MIPSSTAFAQAVSQDSRTFKAQLLYNGSEIDCSITSIYIHKGACDDFAIGALFSSYIEADVSGLSMKLENKEVELKIGVNTGSAYEYITIGKYTVYKPKSTTKTTSFTAYGRISKLTGIPFVEPETKTIGAILQKISTLSGLEIVTTGFNLTGEVSAAMVNMTCWEALACVVFLLGGFATETYDGKIKIHKFGINPQQAVPIDGGRMFSDPVVNDEDYDLTGVKVIVSAESEDEEGAIIEEVSYEAGDPIREVYQSPFMTQALFSQFSTNCLGYEFRPGEVDISLGDPRLEAEDVLYVTDDNEDTYYVPCHQITHTYDGGVQTKVSAQATSESDEEPEGGVMQQLSRINSQIVAVDMAASTAKATAAEATADAAKAKAAALEAEAAAREAHEAVETIETEVTELQDRVQTAEGQLGAVETNIANLGGRVTTAEGNISSVESAIGNPSDSASASGSLFARVKNAKNVADSAVSDITEEVRRAQATEQRIEELAGQASAEATSAGISASIAQSAAEASIEANYRKYNAITMTASEIATKCSHGYSGSWGRANSEGYYQGACNVGDVLLIYVTKPDATIGKLLVRVTTASSAGQPTTGETISWDDNINAYFWHDSEGAHVLGDTYRTDVKDGLKVVRNSNGVVLANIKPDGVTFKSGDGKEITHLGYGETQGEEGTENAPYYDLGIRNDELPIGAYSTIEGEDIAASGWCSHAEGLGRDTGLAAKGIASHAEGVDTVANGTASHAEGDYTFANGYGSHAEGNGSHAEKPQSHAEGERTTASGTSSHAEGKDTVAKGWGSHAEGDHTQANETASHSEGTYTQANEMSAHAEGFHTEANGYQSHAEGKYTIASGDSSHVEGEWNCEDTESKFAHIVGNGMGHIGDEIDRSNAYALEWGGTGRYRGDVYAECNHDSSGGIKLAKVTEIPDVSGKVDKVSGKGLSTNDYTDADKSKLEGLTPNDFLELYGINGASTTRTMSTVNTFYSPHTQGNWSYRSKNGVETNPSWAMPKTAPSNGNGIVVIQEAGWYKIDYEAYFFTGFTAGDRVGAGILKNFGESQAGSHNERIAYGRVQHASAYQTLSNSCMVECAVGDELRLGCQNVTAGRGTISMSRVSKMIITKM